jgi:hypothetical protein
VVVGGDRSQWATHAIAVSDRFLQQEVLKVYDAVSGDPPLGSYFNNLTATVRRGASPEECLSPVESLEHFPLSGIVRA